jgi:hypothetical protein
MGDYMVESSFRKSEIISIGEKACNLLEEGHEEDFFNEIEILLTSKMPFGKLGPLGEYIGIRGMEKPKTYFNIFDKFINKELDYGYQKGHL